MKIAEPPENNHPGLPVGSEGTEDFSKDTVTSIRFPVFHCWELTCLFTPVLPRLNPTSQEAYKAEHPRDSVHLQFPTLPHAPGPGEQNSGSMLANRRASDQKEKPVFLWTFLFFFLWHSRNRPTGLFRQHSGLQCILRHVAVFLVDWDCCVLGGF